MFKKSMLRNTVGPKRENVMRQETYRQQEVAAYMYFAIITFFRFIFYKYMVVIYVFLLEETMYSYC